MFGCQEGNQAKFLHNKFVFSEAFFTGDNMTCIFCWLKIQIFIIEPFAKNTHLYSRTI